ncbi:MAG: hypothetical protein HZB16_10830, partial [Armatimonadetes bacterium]|nr:hypothetical protein [Armatimonadota bacterium]
MSRGSQRVWLCLSLAMTALSAAPVRFGETIGLGVKFSQGQPLSQLPDLKELGVRWVRDGVDWPTIEPTAGNYLPAFPADFAQRLAFYRANHIGVDFLLAYSNPKAYPNTADKPRNEYDAAAYGRYAGQVARLMKASGVEFVLEVWNEPHNSLQKPFGGEWQGKLPSAWVDQYVKMVEETVKNVAAVDPAITVLSQDDMWICTYWFLEKGLPSALGGLSFHPYQGLPEQAAVRADTDWCRPYQCTDADGSYASAVRRLREFGAGKLGHTPQMWATEAGYETGGKSAKGPISEETIAAYVPRTFIVNAAAGVDKMLWFSSFDGPDGPMGLTDNQGRHRKQYDAFRTMSAQLRDCTLVRQVAGADDPVSGLQAFLFQGPDGYRLAAWCIDGTTPALLGKAGGTAIHAVDVMGQPAALTAPVDGTRRVSLGIAPLYISGVPADVTLAPVPKPVVTARLDDLIDGETDWTAGDATLEVLPDGAVPGRPTFRYTVDLSKGWHWNALTKPLGDLNVADVSAVRMKVKTPTACTMDILFVDGTGQSHIVHQQPVNADGAWHDMTIEPRRIAGGEHWGGANDAVWHGPPTSMAILFGTPTPGKLVVDISDARAEATPAVVAQPAAWKADFEAGDTLPAGWTSAGAVSIDAKDGLKGGRSLLLTLPVTATVGAPITATGPTFAVTTGQWRFAGMARSDLKSPDDSFAGVVTLSLLNAAGAVVQAVDLAQLFGQHDWQALAETVEVPAGVTSARFAVRLNKPSGRFWVDDLSAAFLAPATSGDTRVARLIFGTSALGNLWYPGDPRKVEVRVESTKPLLAAQRMVTYELRDYWGAPQTQPAAVAEERKSAERFLYVGEIDLSAAPMETGRYYEIHGAVARPGNTPFENYSALAVLPEAPARRYRPEDVPFTSRDWDNRLTPYLLLTDRVGIRVAGLWGGWSEKPPYNPEAPGIDVVAKTGMGFLSGTPSSTIEAGKSTYDEAALRGGVARFIEAFGKNRPMYISLGNEPSGSGEQVLRNVAAYKIVYEEIKRIDPSIFVVGTSIGPTEEYFRAGFGKYCDAYDFHTYAGVDDIRGAFAQYRELMRRYGPVKPIWSTEMGMNSQGVARNVVAALMIKKFAIFFAEGGQNCSWFDFLYPDDNGTNANSASAAHDVFDSRYSRYAPKLTAISLYDIVNAIGAKKFVAEKAYANGVSAFLFRDRDGRALQILWRDQGRVDVALPLAGADVVRVTLLDGTRRTLNAKTGALTLSVGSEPLLLEYDGGPKTLAEKLDAPLATVDVPTALRGATSTVKVALAGANADEVGLLVPPFWTVRRLAPTTEGGRRVLPFEVTTPENGAAREASYTVTLGSRGELYARAPVAGRLSAELRPLPAYDGKPAGVRLTITNNGQTPQDVRYAVSPEREQALAKGQFGAAMPSSAQFAKAASGTVAVAGGKSVDLDLPLAGADPIRLYRVQAT